jgi:hypothetical protein
VNQAPEKSKAPEQSTKENDNPEMNAEKIPFWRVLLSVLQASFGVQSAKNRERDFTQGKLLPFIVAALLFTLFFVLGVMLAVRFALA